MSDEETPTQPNARITIVGETLTITHYSPALAYPGAIAGDEARERAVTIADVAYLGEPGEYELLITREAPGGFSEQARDVLINWAILVGLRRVWLSDRVIDLTDRVAPVGTASVQCPTCLAEFSADGFSFWSGVRSTGLLPPACKSCGGFLPQWSVAAPEGERGS